MISAISIGLETTETNTKISHQELNHENGTIETVKIATATKLNKRTESTCISKGGNKPRSAGAC